VATSGVPADDEEPQRRRADEAAESLHQWVEKLYGIEFSRLAAGPEVRAAYRDLQTALAHPQLRSAVLLALRAFAQVASAGATTPPPPDAVEAVPRLQERPDVEALSSIHDLNDLLHLAIKRARSCTSKSPMIPVQGTSRGCARSGFPPRRALPDG